MWKKLQEFYRYMMQKKLVKRQKNAVDILYNELQKANDTISRVYKLDTPWVALQKWGAKDVPCTIIQEYNIDYIAKKGLLNAVPRYVFHCPFYLLDEPCNFGCTYNGANAKYFAIRSEYNKMLLRYNKEKMYLTELRMKIWGRDKVK